MIVKLLIRWLIVMLNMLMSYWLVEGMSTKKKEMGREVVIKNVP